MAPFSFFASAESSSDMHKTVSQNSSFDICQPTGKYFYHFKDIALAPYGDQWRKISVLELLTAKRFGSFKEEVSAMIRSIWRRVREVKFQ
jgi:hypothetical protein